MNGLCAASSCLWLPKSTCHLQIITLPHDSTSGFLPSSLLQFSFRMSLPFCCPHLVTTLVTHQGGRLLDIMWFTALDCSRKVLDKWKPQMLIFKGDCWCLLAFSGSGTPLTIWGKIENISLEKYIFPHAHEICIQLQGLSEAHPAPPKCPWDPGNPDDSSSIHSWSFSHRTVAAEKQANLNSFLCSCLPCVRRG